MSAHHRSKSRTGRNLDLLQEAALLRKRAVDLDPDFTDPAWDDEERFTPKSHNTHAALTAFYESKGF
jgi:hypothetical protein